MFEGDVYSMSIAGELGGNLLVYYSTQRHFPNVATVIFIEVLTPPAKVTPEVLEGKDR